MMDAKYPRLALKGFVTQRNVVFKARLESEMEELDLVVKRTLRAWQNAIETQNDLFLDAVALRAIGLL